MAMHGEFNGSERPAADDESGAAPGHAYCLDLVRRADPDRFLCTLLAPAKLRPTLLALYAFNVALGRAAETGGEPVLAQMRLAFWRESIAGLFAGRPAAEPILAALAEAVDGLPRAAFERLIDAHEGTLAGPPKTREALLDRLDAGPRVLFELALAAAGLEGAHALARDAGRAFGLSGTLRAAAWHARAGRLTLPLDLLAAESIAPEDVLECRPTPGLARVAAALAATAKTHLAAARAVRREVPPAGRAVLLPLRLAGADLARLRRRGHDLFDPRVAARGAGRVIAVLWGAASRHY